MDSRIQKNRVLRMLEKYEDKLLRYYLNNGPKALREKLDIDSDDVWKVVFEYLLYEKDSVKVCAKKNSEYICGVFASKGPAFIKKSFCLENPNYKDKWTYVMDYIGISCGALFEYVSKETPKFQNLISNGKATTIRAELCIEDSTYDKIWEEILDMLLECISFTNFTHCQFEQGVRFFTNLYNEGRTHRSVKKSNEIGPIFGKA